ncbi:MAG TPA: dTDP-4-dehydrorhamnose 3,5-epimerase [Trueperaceae bacterium]|nr:dTDP-4-dehydrorhamnose 3,5-epimerase [Trueperaceae bacterium]
MIHVEPLTFPEVRLITPRLHRDARGFFLERYRRDAFSEAGIDVVFVQDNHSRSERGTVRGLHFQRPPHAQAKLVSVVRGTIFDVVVDVRSGSPTFGRWAGAVLDDERCRQLFVPAGFAHGFAVRSDIADVLYKVDAPYAPDSEAGLRWDDPALGIDWGVPGSDVDAPIVSDKDRAWPGLSELDSGFSYRPASG